MLHYGLYVSCASFDRCPSPCITLLLCNTVMHLFLILLKVPNVVLNVCLCCDLPVDYYLNLCSRKTTVNHAAYQVSSKVAVDIRTVYTTELKLCMGVQFDCKIMILKKILKLLTVTEASLPVLPSTPATLKAIDDRIC